MTFQFRGPFIRTYCISWWSSSTVNGRFLTRRRCSSICQNECVELRKRDYNASQMGILRNFQVAKVYRFSEQLKGIFTEENDQIRKVLTLIVQPNSWRISRQGSIVLGLILLLVNVVVIAKHGLLGLAGRTYETIRHQIGASCATSENAQRCFYSSLDK